MGLDDENRREVVDPERCEDEEWKNGAGTERSAVPIGGCVVDRGRRATDKQSNKIFDAKYSFMPIAQ